MFHTIKGFGIVNKAKIDVFLELSCFFDDPADVGNLISGSSASSKTSLNIWKFMVHILLKPGLENFKHYFTSMWDECNCVVVWAFFGIAQIIKQETPFSHLDPSEKKKEKQVKWCPSISSHLGPLSCSNQRSFSLKLGIYSISSIWTEDQFRKWGEGRGLS